METLQRRRGLVPFLVLGMLGLNFLLFMNYREGVKRGYTDFSIFYTAGTIFRQGLGHQLYDRRLQFQVQQSYAGNISFRQGPLPYNHPPFEALIFLPLSFLPYLQAFEAWDLLSLAALFGVAVVLQRRVKIVRETPPWKFVLASLAFFPIFLCFFHGQDSILLLLLCTLAFRAMQNESDGIAGCWLALGSFKFQFTIPIVLLFFIWGRRRLLPGFCAAGIILALVSLALVGSGEFLGYPAFVLRIANTPALGGVPLSLLPNLHGLAMGWPNPFSGTIGMALAATSSVVMFVFAAQKKREDGDRPDLRLQFSLAILVSSLLGWQTTVHDLSLLVLPLALTADYCWGPEGDGSESNWHVLDFAWPLLMSPLWIVLWLGFGKVNLMAVPMLLWVWSAGAAISSGRDLAIKRAD